MTVQLTSSFFFFNDTATTEIYTLSLHDALPISASALVTVSAMDKPFDWSFRNHIQPILAKNGCSAGACHGAAAGQNGFKLSLRGYEDRKSTRLNSSHGYISYAVFCLKKKTTRNAN